MPVPKYDDHLPFAKEVNQSIATLLTHYMNYATKEEVEEFEGALAYAIEAHKG